MTPPRIHTLTFHRDVQCPNCSNAGDLKIESLKDLHIGFFCLRCAGAWNLHFREDAPPDHAAIKIYDRKK